MSTRIFQITSSFAVPLLVLVMVMVISTACTRLEDPTATPVPRLTPTVASTPTATPVPTAEPRPTPTPTTTSTPTSTPGPTATPVPTAEPRPTPTPTTTSTPTSTPGPTATPVPAAEPRPTPTPTDTSTPTSTPGPTATPVPTAEPRPTPTPTAAPTPTSTPGPSLTGELTGEIVFAHSTVTGNINYLETKSLPQEGLIALVDVTGLDLSGDVLSYVFEPHIIAYGNIDQQASRRSPVSFTIKYDLAGIDPDSDYAIFVRYSESSGKGLTSQGIYYANHYGREATPTRVLTHGHPRRDVIVRIDLIHWIS